MNEQAKRADRNCIVGRLRAGGFEVRTPVGARFFAPVQTDTEVYPASCTMGTGARSIRPPVQWEPGLGLGGKVAGAWR